MKKLLSVILLIACGWVQVIGQTADPYISINMNPPVVNLNANGSLDIIAGNAANDNIVANSLRITISVGSNAEIQSLDPSSDARWSQFFLTAGNGNTIALTNTGISPFGPFDLGFIHIIVKGTSQGGTQPQTITGNITYITGPNPLLGGAQSASQGNANAFDDNSTSSLMVTNILPVTVRNFNGAPYNCLAKLNWTTSTELDLNKFDVEYSRDGFSFVKVGTVNGKNLSYGSNYQFLYDQGVGRGYYRLNMVDMDGRSTYSSTISIDVSCNGKKTMTLYPNPVPENQQVTLVISGYDNALKGELFTISGQQVATFSLKNGANTLAVDNLTQGTYMLRVTENGKEAQSFKIVILK